MSLEITVVYHPILLARSSSKYRKMAVKKEMKMDPARSGIMGKQHFGSYFQATQWA